MHSYIHTSVTPRALLFTHTHTNKYTSDPAASRVSDPDLNSVTPNAFLIIQTHLYSYPRASDPNLILILSLIPFYPPPTPPRLIPQGFCGIKDPARPEVAEAILKCTQAGEQVIRCDVQVCLVSHVSRCLARFGLPLLLLFH